MLGGSEAGQASFVELAFEAWDRHADDISLVEFTWSTDVGAEAVSVYHDYYGIADERFGAYLASIGLLRADGVPKPAYETLRDEVAARGL